MAQLLPMISAKSKELLRLATILELIAKILRRLA